MLALQRSAGNAAVASMLAGRRSATRLDGRSVGNHPVAPVSEVDRAPAEPDAEQLLPTDLAGVGGVVAASPHGTEPDEPDAGTADGSGTLDGPPVDVPEPIDVAEQVDVPEPTDAMVDDEHDDEMVVPASRTVGGAGAPLQRLSLSDLPGAGLVKGAVDAVGDLAGGALGAVKGKVASLTGAIRSGWGTLQASAGARLSGLGDQIRGGVAAVGRLGSSISTGISQGFAGATRTMGALTSGFTRAVNSGLATVKGAAGSLGRALTAMDADGLRAAYAAIKGSVSRVHGSLTTAASAITAQGRALWDGLTGRLNNAVGSLRTFASGMVGRLQATAASTLTQVNGLWERLRGTASGMDGVGGIVARAAAAVVDRLLAGLRSLWNGISSAWNAVQGSLSSVASRVTAQLAAARDGAERQARGLLDRFRATWATVSDRAVALTRTALGGVADMAGRLGTFSLEKTITQVSAISRFLKWVSTARAQAEEALDARATQIAGMIDAGMPGAARTQVAQHVPGGAAPGSTVAPPLSGTTSPSVQREPDGSVGTRSSLSFGSTASTVWTAIDTKWGKLSAKEIVLDMLRTFIWPWPAVGREFVAIWDDWKSAAHRLFAPRFDSVGTFFQDLWTDLLTLADFPWTIVKHLVNIVGALMGWVTIILMAAGAVFFGAIGSLIGPEGTVAGAIFGAGAGLGVSGAAGAAVLAAFVATQTTDLVKRLAELATANLTVDEQKENVDRASDSAVGLGIAVLIAAIVWLAGQLAGAFLDVVRKIKTGTPKELPPPEEGPPSEKPKTAESPPRPVRSDGQPVSDAAMEALGKATADRQAVFRQHPDFLERFAGMSAVDQAFLNAISDPAFGAFANLPEPLQARFLTLSRHVYTPTGGQSISFRTNYEALPSQRQVALLTEVEIAAAERTAALDTQYQNENGVTKQGHGFGEHGAYRSDAEMFARAKAKGSPVSRYNSSAQQDAQAVRFRQVLEDPSTPQGDSSPINKKGHNAIKNGSRSAQQILNDPANNSEFLKSKVTFKEQPAGQVIGTEFDADGVTTRPVDKATVVFELDSNGKYQVLTNFPEL